MKERDPLGLLGLAERVGSGEMLHFMEQDGGARLREQNPDDEGWVELPAQLDTSGAYGHLGYYEATEAKEMGWGRDRSLFDDRRNQFVPGTFCLHNTDIYQIQVATYREVGFEFYEEDLRKYIAWLEYDNRHHQRQDVAEAWMSEHGCYYSGQGEEPYKSQARAMRDWIHAARRWGEEFYLRGQRYAIWIRMKLPAGWQLGDDGHPQGLWTVITDADGVERGTVFYKAYESCHMRLKYHHDEETHELFMP